MYYVFLSSEGLYSSLCVSTLKNLSSIEKSILPTIIVSRIDFTDSFYLVSEIDSLVLL